MSDEETSEANESKRYGDMLRDVEAIVNKVSDEQTDLDEMIAQVESGYKLITQMKSRLAEAKGKIEALEAGYKESNEPAS